MDTSLVRLLQASTRLGDKLCFHCRFRLLNPLAAGLRSGSVAKRAAASTGHRSRESSPHGRASSNVAFASRKSSSISATQGATMHLANGELLDLGPPKVLISILENRCLLRVHVTAMFMLVDMIPTPLSQASPSPREVAPVAHAVVSPNPPSLGPSKLWPLLHIKKHCTRLATADRTGPGQGGSRPHHLSFH